MDWPRGDRRASARLAVVGALAALLLPACAGSGPPDSPLLRALAAPAVAAPSRGYDFFAAPGPRDGWTLRISRWQMRQRAAYRAGLIRPNPKLPSAELPSVGTGAPGSAAERSAGSLAARYGDFMSRRRREVAAEVLAWVQQEAEASFRDDGSVDHWPTLPEVLVTDGDDCDGLELLTYHALRQLGFPEDRVFRAILRGTRFGQHHMVTLWFEDRADPWVLDPTATATTRMLHLSELAGWVPLKLFSETREYSVTAR